MRGRLAIRTRLAIVSATLAVGVLAAGLLTVYLIDRRQVDQTLTTAARRAAADLAAAGLHDGVFSGGPRLFFQPEEAGAGPVTAGDFAGNHR